MASCWTADCRGLGHLHLKQQRVLPAIPIVFILVNELTNHWLLIQLLHQPDSLRWYTLVRTDLTPNTSYVSFSVRDMNNVPWYRFPVAHLTRCVSPLCKCHDSLDKAYHLTIWRSACLQGATSDHHSLSLGQRIGVRCHTRLLQWKIFHGANHRRQQVLPWRPGASPAELCVLLPASDALQQISASICVSRHSGCACGASCVGYSPDMTT